VATSLFPSFSLTVVSFAIFAIFFGDARFESLLSMKNMTCLRLPFLSSLFYSFFVRAFFSGPSYLGFASPDTVKFFGRSFLLDATVTFAVPFGHRARTRPSLQGRYGPLGVWRIQPFCRPESWSDPGAIHFSALTQTFFPFRGFLSSVAPRHAEKSGLRFLGRLAPCADRPQTQL